MKWKYKVYSPKRGAITEKVLNTLGEDGWELVTAHTHYDYIVLYLKQPK